MSEDQDFGLQSCPRTDEPDHRAPDQSAEIAHWTDDQPIRRSPSAVFEFPARTGSKRGEDRRRWSDPRSVVDFLAVWHFCSLSELDFGRFRRRMRERFAFDARYGAEFLYY